MEAICFPGYLYDKGENYQVDWQKKSMVKKT